MRPKRAEATPNVMINGEEPASGAAGAWEAPAREELRPEQTRTFVSSAFRDDAIPSTGTAITTILPPTSRFTPSSGHASKKQTVLDRLTALFDRFAGII